MSEAVPADFFATLELGDPKTRQERICEVFEGWAPEGCAQIRVTFVGPGYDRKAGYPDGIWIEGWKDRLATQLPFGAAYPEDGPCYPPLVAEVDD